MENLDLLWILAAFAVMGAATITFIVTAIYYTLEAVALYRRMRG